MSTAVSESRDRLRSLVDQRIERWRAGDRPDAAGFVSEHPELAKVETLVLDLVQEEYCLRVKSGEAIDKGRLFDRLPGHRRSIEKLLEVEQFLDQCPQFALADQRVPWPVPGREFLGYEVVKELGSGTFACVFLAREPDLGHRLVVIKVSRYGMFEAGTLGKLSHPSIMPIHSVQYDMQSGWTAICMPLLGTATAVDLLRRAFAVGQPADGRIIARVGASTRPVEGLSPGVEAAETQQWRGPYADAIARFGLQLAEGLQAAHAAGVRHHDIKPSNVLLSWSGRPLLLDFNLAVDDLAVVNRPGGTQAYLAPELAAHWRDRTRRAALRQDPRCDIYSLGAVLYQLLVNQTPAREPSELCRPRSLQPAIDPGLDAIVMKCLAFDPAERFATAGALATELRAYLARPKVAQRFVKRHRRAFLAAGVALGAAAATGAAYVASLKPYPERLLEQGISAYEQGDYSSALTTLDRCVELQRETPEVRFARGQTLLRLERWNDARADFRELQAIHMGWSLALTGRCCLGTEDVSAAHGRYRFAYQEGLRDRTFLLNLADAARRRKHYVEAIQIYSEILIADPNCATAVQGRAHAAYAMSYDGKRTRVQPHPQALVDARANVRLQPGKLWPLHIAALICGYTVSLDSGLAEQRHEGNEYLRLALLVGMSRQTFVANTSRFEPLMTDDLWPLVAQAPTRPVNADADLMDRPEFSRQPRWREFLAQADDLAL